MAESSVTIRLLLKDLASKGLKDMLRAVKQWADGVSMYAKIAIGALTGFAVKAVLSFTDVNESLNKFRATFGDAAEDMSKRAASMGKAIQRSKYEIQDALAVFQSFFLGLKLSGEEAARMSEKMVKLAYDFASFHNLSDAEAVERFISALSGSSEVLAMFGINIKEAALSEELLASGMAESSKKATELQKTLARVNVIAKSMGKQGAIGDAAATAGSFANQLKGLKADLLDLSVAIGERLMPHARALLTWLRSAARVLKADMVVYWGKWVAGISAALILLPKIIAIVQGLTIAMQALAKATIWAYGVGGPKGWAKLAAGMAVAAVAVHALEKQFEKMGEASAAALQKVNAAYEDMKDMQEGGKGQPIKGSKEAYTEAFSSEAEAKVLEVWKRIQAKGDLAGRRFKLRDVEALLDSMSVDMSDIHHRRDEVKRLMPKNLTPLGRSQFRKEVTEDFKSRMRTRLTAEVLSKETGKQLGEITNKLGGHLGPLREAFDALAKPVSQEFKARGKQLRIQGIREGLRKDFEERLEREKLLWKPGSEQKFLPQKKERGLFGFEGAQQAYRRIAAAAGGRMPPEEETAKNTRTMVQRMDELIRATRDKKGAQGIDVEIEKLDRLNLGMPIA